EYDLAKCLGEPRMEAISRILDRTVTPDPMRRLANAEIVGHLIEEARYAMENQRPIAGVPATYSCMFCGVGTYQVVCTSAANNANWHNAGYKEGNVATSGMVFLECDNCGNSQRFKLRKGGPRWFPDAVEDFKRQG